MIAGLPRSTPVSVEVPMSAALVEASPESASQVAPGATSLEWYNLRQLRAAVQRNAISFPSQMPVFAGSSRPDIQWRMAHLFFVGRWSIKALAQRYKLTSQWTRSVIRDWIDLAIHFGYVEEIPPPLWGKLGDSKPIVEFRKKTHVAEAARSIQLRGAAAPAQAVLLRDDNERETPSEKEIEPIQGMEPPDSEFPEDGASDLVRAQQENECLRSWIGVLVQIIARYSVFEFTR